MGFSKTCFRAIVPAIMILAAAQAVEVPKAAESIVLEYQQKKQSLTQQPKSDLLTVFASLQRKYEAAKQPERAAHVSKEIERIKPLPLNEALAPIREILRVKENEPPLLRILPGIWSCMSEVGDNVTILQFNHDGTVLRFDTGKAENGLWKDPKLVVLSANSFKIVSSQGETRLQGTMINEDAFSVYYHGKHLIHRRLKD